MLLLRFVCLSVCVSVIQESEVRNPDSLDYRITKRILMKFYGELGCGLETSCLHFGDDLHDYADPGQARNQPSHDGGGGRFSQIVDLFPSPLSPFLPLPSHSLSSVLSLPLGFSSLLPPSPGSRAPPILLSPLSPPLDVGPL